MAEIIRMPRLSDTMEEGNIVSWLKKVGDEVKPGDVLAEVETDKATMELESYNEGFLLYIGIESGPVPVDGIIAIIGEKGEDYKSQLKDAEKESSSTKEEAEPKKEELKEPVAAPTKDIVAPKVEAKAISNTGGIASSDHLKASPLAKSLAKEKGIDISLVSGSGEGGRIVKKDIINYVPQQTNSASNVEAQVLEDFVYGDVAVSQMRKTIAKRLGESKFSSPHFYLTMEIIMDEAIAARKQINELAPPKISFNDLVVKASAAALRKNPKINASWHGDKITYHKDINIGVAVAVEDGLVVPVIRNTDTKSLSTINAEVKTLAGKARSKKIQPSEMQGNTFTISNLGMYGIDEFTAIINPPDACILAVGGISHKAIVVDGQIVPASIMKVTLSCDHRIVDGATGAQFLQSFKAYLENPVRLLV
jgi:pyruvate dehydrogenase E2 component (dihydrolipoamide acetyltransferase)